MVNFKRLIKLLIVVFTFSLLASCNISTFTQVVINDDLSGERIIEYLISRDDINSEDSEYIERLENLIESKVPNGMTYEKNETPDFVQYYFKISFRSPDEYERKIEEILDKDVQIEFEKKDDVFESGIILKESFKSSELMKWINEAIEEEKLEGEEKDKINSLKNSVSTVSTTIFVNDTEYMVDDRISFEAVNEFNIEYISIDTIYLEDNTFSRTIRFEFDKYFYEVNEKNISEFFESLVPMGAEADFTEDEYGFYFYISFDAKDINELNEKTAIALDNDKGIFTIESEEIDDDIYGKCERFSEELYFDTFLPNDNSGIYIYYGFYINNDINILYGDYGNIDSKNLYLDQYGRIITMSLVTEKKYSVIGIDVTTDIISPEEAEKTLKITFEDGTPKEFLDLVEKIFMIEGYDEVESEVNGKNCTVSIALKGSPAYISDYFSYVLYYNNSIGYSTYESSKYKEGGRFYEYMDLTELYMKLGYSGIANYTLKNSTGIKILNNNGSMIGEISSNGNEISGIIENGYLEYYLDGEKTLSGKIVGTVFIWILIIAAIIFSLVILLKKLSKRDEFKDKDLKEVLMYYGKNIWSVLGQALSRIRITPSCIPKENINIYLYFYHSPMIYLKIYIAVFMGFIMLYLFEFVLQGLRLIGRGGITYGMVKSVETVNSAFIKIGLSLCIIIFIVGEFWIRLKCRNSTTEKQIDECINKDINGYRTRAMKKFGIVEENVAIIDPVQIVGPCELKSIEEIKKTVQQKRKEILMRILFGPSTRNNQSGKRDNYQYNRRLIFRKGKDDKIRYSLIKDTIYLYSEEQVYIYEIMYDLVTGDIFNEGIMEIAYKNINTITTGERCENILSGKDILTKNYKFFRIISKSNTLNEAIIDHESEILENQVMAMKNLIRDKKEYLKRV